MRSDAPSSAASRESGSMRTGWRVWRSREIAVRDRLADDVGQVDVQVAAARDVQDLHAAADRERGRRAPQALLHQRELEGVALGAGRVDRVVIGARAEALRLDVAAAAEHDAVERGEQRRRILVARRQQHRLPAAGAHRVDVRRGHREARSLLAFAVVGGDSDERPPHGDGGRPQIRSK